MAVRHYSAAVRTIWGRFVKLFTDRQLDLVKKALEMATFAIELRPVPSRSNSDHVDMKALLEAITESDVELAYYVIAAQMAITGKPEEAPRLTGP